MFLSLFNPLTTVSYLLKKLVFVCPSNLFRNNFTREGGGVGKGELTHVTPQLALCFLFCRGKARGDGGLCASGSTHPGDPVGGCVWGMVGTTWVTVFSPKHTPTSMTPMGGQNLPLWGDHRRGPSRTTPPFRGRMTVGSGRGGGS